MKISIGAKIIEGPYGGGNSFVKNLKRYFEKDGHQVTHFLDEKDIDVIFLINPLRDSSISTFNHFDVGYYQKFINPNSISIHRINECDERKNTTKVNYQIIKANKLIDSSIFVSSWIKNLYLDKGLDPDFSRVVLGGPLKQIFNKSEKLSWNGIEKLKIVTHHWSTNINKGFEFYKQLDNLLDDKYWKKQFEFTYIGNIPKGLNFKNTKTLSAKFEKNLAEELKKHHIYITGSKNEPSGNHHMEAALCGLPILYIESGALPEYCKDIGESFNKNNIAESLLKLKKNYYNYYDELDNYNYDFEHVYDEIIDFIHKLQFSKKELVSNRKYFYRKTFLLEFILNYLSRKINYFYLNFRKLLGLLKKIIYK